MKVLKVLKYVAIVLLSIAVGFVCATLVKDGAADNFDWQGYVEQTLMPYVTIALSSIGTLCALAFPVVKGIIEAGNKFKDATGDVVETVKSGKTSADSIKIYTEKLVALEAENKELSQNVKNLTEMVKIGFCNNPDLVVNGYAAEIAKVGTEDGRDEEKAEV